MRLSFRQGIIGHQAGGFLHINALGNVNLLALNRAVQVSVAHHSTNYTHTENNTVEDAWLGPFSASTNYWLYWDFNTLTFERTFGYTVLEPVAQSVEPGSGNVSIIEAVPGAAGIGYFVVNGFFPLTAGTPFDVVNSTANNGTYNVGSYSYNGTLGQTTIVVNQEVVDNTPDGELTLDVDSDGFPLLTVGRHWYDTTNNQHFVWQGSGWSEVLRVFAAQITNGNTFVPQTITGGSFVGTQIGDTSSVRSGRVLFDESANPILRDNKTFFTTEDQFYTSAARTDALRLESNVAFAQFNDDPAIAEFHVVAWNDDGQARLAQYNDIGSTVLGILTEDVLIGEIGSVIIQGVVTNPSWTWTEGLDAVPVGSELWIENGELVSADPHVTDVLTYPQGQVPVARVLSNDTVVFEQGLGGKGDQGPPGELGDLPPATTTTLGAVTLTVDSSNPLLAIVPSDLDPRLSDARIPLPHIHPASEVSYVPGGGLTSTDVQGALTELGNSKLNLAGGTMLGFLTLNTDPTAALHAATKQYVDGLVSGLVWLDPICMVNMISDTETTPPGSPEYSDAYLIPPGGGTDAWSAIPAGNITVWDGSTWLDRGALTSLNPDGARLGISMTSSTTAGGNYAGQDNNIALYDSGGSLTGFEVPTTNNAVFVCNSSSFHAFNQYAFSGTDWVLFGGGSSLIPDNVTIEQNGNILSVKQFSDGGINDVQFWQGLEPSDLATIYAPIVHTHPATSVTVTPYTTSPDWGTAVDPTINHILTTNVQAALQELMDKKAAKTPVYNLIGDLPLATNVEGMVALVSSVGRLYFAYSGSWIPLGNAGETLSIPYDISFFAAGPMINVDEPIGSFVATRTVTIPAAATDSIAVVGTAPAAPVAYIVKVNGSNFGTISFGVGMTLGTIVLTGTGSPPVLTLTFGDILTVHNPSVVEGTIKDLTITLVGCAQAAPC